MKIMYEIGPEKVAMGPINDQTEFSLGQPKEVPDELAERILAKKTIIFTKVEE